MPWRQLSKQLFGLFRPGLRSGRSSFARARGSVTHVIILDGTMSTLTPGNESNAGITYRLLSEQSGADMSVYYEAGVQWIDWRRTPDVMMGRGINRQIRRAYGYLASRYRPGDRIFLFGFSRGAYAVRSLAGVIDRVGLLRAECATERNVQTAYRHYQTTPGGRHAADFAADQCHDGVEIEMVGVWDTVKALGTRVPLLWKWAEEQHAFHNHTLGPSIRHGFHALGLDETRLVYTPVLWDCPPDWTGRVEQVWFRGNHGDVGGHLSGFNAARPLSNIPLTWMLDRAERCGLALPANWRARFPCDAQAPSMGSWRGWSKIFLLRRARVVGQDRSERVHHTVPQSVRDRTGLAVLDPGHP